MKIKPIAKYITLSFILGLIVLAIYAYRGTLINEEFNNNKLYSIRYYSSINPLSLHWTMPGGSTCRPIWIRLYDSLGNKQNELYSDDCSLENKLRWTDDEVLLPDGETIWSLESTTL